LEESLAHWLSIVSNFRQCGRTGAGRPQRIAKGAAKTYARRVKVSGVLLVLGAALVVAPPARAHLGLIYPPSRYGQDILKVGPCGLGGGSRSSNVTVLEPGATIDVLWDEYVDHPGHFRIAFDDDGDDDFVDPPCLSGCNTLDPDIEIYSNDTVLLDDIADTPRGGESGARVTLPDIECDNCTLQVIQVMYDKPPYVIPGNDIYYQCVDLVLRRSAPLPTATPSATASPTAAPPTPTPSPQTPLPSPTCDVAIPGSCADPCAGDCDGSGVVNVDELVTMIAIALGNAEASGCIAGDKDGGGSIEVDDIIAALHSSLAGCTTS
jgi:hypothetical protein